MHDVIVIGAGVAGLSAARSLVRGGRDVVVLEGRTRIGGRIHTIHDARCPVPIELGAFHHHDWSSDPFARGAYSYALVGGARAAAALARPAGKTLFFAGEHTMPSPENGTVEGAIASGERAAKQLRQG